LCSYLYLKLVKCHVSHFIFSVFSSIKSENGRVEQVLQGWGVGGKVGTSGSGEEGVGGYGANYVYTCMCVHAKMIPVETIPGIGGGG
jgi:precorrin-3B methylase